MHAECRSYRDREPATKVSKGGEVRWCMTGSESQWADSERAVHEAVTVKLKLPWKRRKSEMPGMWKICKGKLGSKQI